MGCWGSEPSQCPTAAHAAGRRVPSPPGDVGGPVYLRSWSLGGDRPPREGHQGRLVDETRPKQWMLSSSSAARGRCRPPRRLKRCRSRQGAFMRPDTVVDVVSASASTAFPAKMLTNTRADDGASCRTTVEGFARPLARRQWSRGPAGAADHKSVPHHAERGCGCIFFCCAGRGRPKDLPRRARAARGARTGPCAPISRASSISGVEMPSPV